MSTVLYALASFPSQLVSSAHLTVGLAVLLQLHFVGVGGLRRPFVGRWVSVTHRSDQIRR